jgi:hypothetical protein
MGPLLAQYFKSWVEGWKHSLLVCTVAVKRNRHQVLHMSCSTETHARYCGNIGRLTFVLPINKVTFSTCIVNWPFTFYLEYCFMVNYLISFTWYYEGHSSYFPSSRDAGTKTCIIFFRSDNGVLCSNPSHGMDVRSLFLLSSYPLSCVELLFFGWKTFQRNLHKIFKHIRGSQKIGNHLPLTRNNLLVISSKFRKAIMSFVIYVRLYSWKHSAPNGRIFINFDTWVYFSKKKLSRKFKISLNSDKNNGYFTRKPSYVFNNISLSSS